jgi:catechol 2,3-dioxygenase-like lactoylglutathione lyase family enzyme
MHVEEIDQKLMLIKCQHVSLEVSNVDKSLDFYRTFLGLKLTERHSANENPAIPFEMAFLRLGKQHHDLVLTHDPKKEYIDKSQISGPVGIHHYALECPNKKSFDMYLQRANDLNLEIVRGPVLHSAFQKLGDGTWGENWSFYVLDPDHHRIEIFCEMATIDVEGNYVTDSGQIVPTLKAEEI